MQIEAIDTRRATLQAELERLRDQRGDAVKKSERPKLNDLHDEIIHVESELAALNDAEASTERADRAAKAERAAKELARDREDMKTNVARYLDAVDACEQATLAQVAALRDAQFASSELDRLSKKIGGKPSSQIGPHEMERQISNLVSAALMKVTGKLQFGVLKCTPLPVLGLRPLDLSGGWREIEEKRIGAAVNSYQQRN